MRVRKPSNKGGVNKFIGKFPSYRLNLLLWFESILERDFLYLLEFDHFDVVSFHDQPCRIRYRLDGKRYRYRYTPDFYVVRKHKRQIIEVKPLEKAQDKKNRARYKAASHICELEGYEFKVVTEVDIQKQPRLDNIKLLLKYQRTPLHPEHQILAHEFFDDRAEATLAEVTSLFVSKGIEPQVVYSLVRWGLLSVDLMTPVEADSVVRLPADDSGERMLS